MFTKLSVVKRLFYVAALLFMILSILPAARVSADEGPGFTPKQQAQADRLKTQYHKLNKDLHALDALFDRAASDRQAYVSFMYGEQVNGHNADDLARALKTADEKIATGRKYQNIGIQALDYPNGLDSNGNVVDINKISSALQLALPRYLDSRNSAASAIYYMRSALNLYHQQSASRYSKQIDVPNIPKYHPPLYCLACTIPE